MTTVDAEKLARSMANVLVAIEPQDDGRISAIDVAAWLLSRLLDPNKALTPEVQADLAKVLQGRVDDLGAANAHHWTVPGLLREGARTFRERSQKSATAPEQKPRQVQMPGRHHYPTVEEKADGIRVGLDDDRHSG